MKYYFLDIPSGIYSAPTDIPGGSISDEVMLTQSDCTVIYDIYDDLVRRFPDHVTKTTLAEISGFDFNRYTFRNYPLENTSDFPVRRFKICIVTSIHGYEQGCAWTAAQFFRLMCESETDPILNFLRRNVVFEVIPVANPWGFSHNVRRNAAGVDLNRNFEKDFIYGMDPASMYYGGQSPCTEEETRLLMQFVEDNIDAEVVFDYHNIGRGYPLYYVYTEKEMPFAHSVFATLTDKWKQEYPQLPKDRILGRVKPNGKEGMFADYLLDKGLWALTLETPLCMPVIGEEQYDSTTIRCALDVLVNSILAIVKSCS